MPKTLSGQAKATAPQKSQTIEDLIRVGRPADVGVHYEPTRIGHGSFVVASLRGVPGSGDKGKNTHR